MVVDLSGEMVMVTGASRGLGRALAEAYGAAGASLALCARGPELDAVVEGLRGRGVRVVAGQVDVTDANAVAALVRRAEAVAPVSVLVNNASVLGARDALAEYPLDDWRRVVDINVTGALIAAQAVLPGMRAAERGSIINVTSGVGNVARARWGAYGVSKWALEALTYNLALEEKPAGIRVNAVDPGAMGTDMRHAAYPQEDPDSVPAPAQVTGVFLWLASGESDATGERFRAQAWP
ncbi:MAG TPA: SDR family oxidoreductase [Longimicrobiales bacterium]|nr:SDR family oxidoreductase [Longimicrobiales bacterium]